MKLGLSLVKYRLYGWEQIASSRYFLIVLLHDRNELTPGTIKESPVTDFEFGDDE